MFKKKSRPTAIRKTLDDHNDNDDAQHVIDNDNNDTQQTSSNSPALR